MPCGDGTGPLGLGPGIWSNFRGYNKFQNAKNTIWNGCRRFYWQTIENSLNSEEEKEILKREAELLKKSLENINKRIEALEKNQQTNKNNN